jgi:hypothetical protein
MCVAAQREDSNQARVLLINTAKSFYGWLIRMMLPLFECG